jgi:hypothetical protein
MSRAIAMRRWVALSQPWKMVDRNIFFKEFETQPVYYQKWLESRAGKGHALKVLAGNVPLVEYLIARKSRGKQDSTVHLDHLCNYLWASEKTPLDALERSVENNNSPIAQYIHYRVKPLCNVLKCLQTNRCQ